MATPKYDVHCPTCAALPGDPCRTRKTQRVTDTHADRILNAYPLRCADCGGDEFGHVAALCRLGGAS